MDCIKGSDHFSHQNPTEPPLNTYGLYKGSRLTSNPNRTHRHHLNTWHVPPSTRGSAPRSARAACAGRGGGRGSLRPTRRRPAGLGAAARCRRRRRRRDAWLLDGLVCSVGLVGSLGACGALGALCCDGDKCGGEGSVTCHTTGRQGQWILIERAALLKMDHGVDRTGGEGSQASIDQS